MSKRSVQHGTFTIEREAKDKWFGGPSGQWKPLERQMEFRVGGHERARGRWASGRTTDFQATYHDIVPDRRIVYSYAMHVDDKKISVSLATIEFAPAGRGTKLILTEQGAFLDGYDDAGSRERGTAGLMDALGKSLEDTP